MTKDHPLNPRLDSEMNAILLSLKIWTFKETYIHILMLVKRTYIQDTQFKVLGDPSRENLKIGWSRKGEPTIMCDLDVMIIWDNDRS